MAAKGSYRETPPRLIAGERALDFVNTVAWRGDPAARDERLTGYGEFLLWAEAAALIDAADHRRLADEAARRPAAARKAVGEAVTLREALAAFLAARSGPALKGGAIESIHLSSRSQRGIQCRPGSLAALGTTVGSTSIHHALATLNTRLAAVRFRYRLELADDGGLRAIASGDVETLRQPLARLACDIVELLASDRLDRVGHCADHRCGWYFVDTSRNRSRLWCDMADCGNNAKARAFYRRRRSSRAAP